jgi:hypothetical protein
MVAVVAGNDDVERVDSSGIRICCRMFDAQHQRLAGRELAGRFDPHFFQGIIGRGRILRAPAGRGFAPRSAE